MVNPDHRQEANGDSLGFVCCCFFVCFFLFVCFLFFFCFFFYLLHNN